MSKWLRNIFYILLLAGSFFVFGLPTRPSLLSRGEGAGVKIAYATEKGDVVINEIMWMGTNEWIELKNTSSEDIDLSGWQITKLVAGAREELMLTIPAGMRISQKSYFLIARYGKGEKSVLNIEPDYATSTVVLVDTKLQIKIYDRDWAAGNYLDIADDGIGTPLAGEYDKSRGIYLSMERNDISGDGTQKENWRTCSQAVNLVEGAIECGTPRHENSESVSAGSGDGGEEGNEIGNLKLEIGEGEDVTEGKTGGDEGEIRNLKLEIKEESEEGQEEKKEKKTILTKDLQWGAKTPSAQAGLLKKGTVLPGKIVINEIFPNPKGADFKDEFIELKNIGGQEVNVENWIIKNNENQYEIIKTDFPVAIIPAGGFFVLYREKTNIALNNSGDKAELFSETGKKIDSISYKEYGKENISYARIEGIWQWTAAISPCAENIFIALNGAPQSVIDASGKAEIFSGSEIIFDASDSFDPDGDKLSYFWKSSTGREAQDLFFKEKFNSPGEYKISLKVSDSHNNENISEFKIKVLDNFFDKSLPKAAAESKAEPIVYNNNEWGNVIISEIMPNPAGDETTGEWIKLFNYENYPVSLAGWVLDDKEGGSSPYYIPSDVVIQANSFFLFESGKTGIALNNDGDEARLLDPSVNIISDVKYDKSYEGKIFSYDEETGHWNWGDEGASQKSKVKSQKLGEGKEGIEWEEGKDGDWKLEDSIGKQINIEGYVSVKPGNLGVQVFYLTNGEKGIEVYCYKKDFPELEVGDYISVSGTVIAKDGWRLAINGQDDVKILSYEHPPLAKELNSPDFLNLPAQAGDDLHNLVSIKGEVLEKQGKNLYIYFAEKEVKIYINEYTGISLKDIEAGAQIQVIGILDYLNDEFRIIPRSQEDLQIEKGIVLGKIAERNGQEGECSIASSSGSGENVSADLANASEKRTKIILGLSARLISLAVIGWIIWRRSR